MEGLALTVTEIPRDETPPSNDAPPPGPDADGLLGVTEDAPFGYFPDRDGNPDYSRGPRKRRPKGHSKTTVTARSGSADTKARQAAALLATMNKITGASLMSFGMPMTGETIVTANAQFEDMAYEALKLDPALANKILSAGGNSGKTGLIMAYSMLAMAIMPVGYMELKSKRKETVYDEPIQ